MSSLRSAVELRPSEGRGHGNRSPPLWRGRAPANPQWRRDHSMKHDSLEHWIRLAAFADRPASKPVAASPSYNFSEPRDDVEVAERLAIASEVRLPAVGTPARIKMDRAHNVMISGLLAVGRMRI